MSFASEIRRHFGKEDESGIKKLQEDIRKIYKDINDEKKSDCISDIEKVCKDLNEIYMDEDNENMVIETIRSLSFYQNLPWFREAFKRLLSFLEEDYYLRTDAMRNVLDSGWASNESYAFSEDDRGDAFIKKLLPDIVEEFYLDLPEDVLEDELLNLKRDAFIKRFFLGRYIYRNPDCLKILQDKYQYLYKVLEKEIELIKDRPGSYEKKLMEDILRISQKIADAEGIRTYSSISTLQESLIDTYYKNLIAEYPNEADDLRDERSKWLKIRGNDTCPCGSGRKFKKCHGA